MSAAPLVRLGDCCEIVSGATPKTAVAEYWGGDIAWATPKDLSNLDSKYIASTPQKLTEAGYRSCSAKIMPAGSVLFSSRAPIGHVAISSFPMCTNQGFKSFVPDPKRISADYLYHWLRANKAYLQSLGNGATFKEVSKVTVAKVQVPLPPLAEQRRIAAILDKADALRAKRRETIAKLNQLLQSVFLDMFGDPVSNSRAWPIQSLGKLCDVRDGTHASPKYVETGYPLATSKNLVSGRVNVNGAQLISEEDFVSINKRSKVDRGDLLMPMIGTIGNPVLVDLEPNYAIKNIALIKFGRTSVSNVYVLHLLKSRFFDVVAARKNRGGSQKFLALGDIRGMQIPVPDVRSQDNFNRFVERIEQQKQLMQSSADQLASVFASLQHRAFSGTL